MKVGRFSPRTIQTPVDIRKAANSCGAAGTPICRPCLIHTAPVRPTTSGSCAWICRRSRNAYAGPGGLRTASRESRLSRPLRQAGSVSCGSPGPMGWRRSKGPTCVRSWALLCCAAHCSLCGSRRTNNLSWSSSAAGLVTVSASASGARVGWRPRAGTIRKSSSTITRASRLRAHNSLPGLPGLPGLPSLPALALAVDCVDRGDWEDRVDFNMKLSDFDYALPPELIAQHPVEPRDAARLLVVDRPSGRFEHRVFRDLPEYLRPADVLAVNDTRVIPARLRARKNTGGAVEGLLLRPAADGAVAAPTAGLHFTPALLTRIEGRGVRIAALTLHIGLGTFRPVTVEDVRYHRMDPEWYEVSAAAADLLTAARRGPVDAAQGRGRIVAVGTSAVRTLETVTVDDGSASPSRGWSGLFIYPGYRFKATDALITNFHLPKTTLLMLGCAFAGRDLILRAYQEAIKAGYRFYSFGDAMLIL